MNKQNYPKFKKNSKLEVDGKPVGEYFHQGMHARTHGRTTRKHNAAAAHCRMGDRGMKIHFKSSPNGKQNRIIEVRFYRACSRTEHGYKNMLSCYSNGSLARIAAA